MKNWISAVTPVRTGVQSVRNAMETLDSGFRRNDVKKTAKGGFLDQEKNRRPEKTDNTALGVIISNRNGRPNSESEGGNGK